MNELVRLWKDPEYRLAHGKEEQAHPAGLVPLEDSEVPGVGGLMAAGTAGAATMGCCHGFTSDWQTCGYTLLGSTLCVAISLAKCH